jgi:hypothetical protein
MNRTVAAGLLAATALIGAGATAAGVGSTTPRAQLAGSVDPAAFAHPQPNAYFPLTPGTVTRLRGSEDGEHFRERVTITHRTRMIQGVRTTVISDITRRGNGVLAEKTTDWYAGDSSGNVWYFGESTATYDEQGHLESREGSWQAGVRGAVAGLIMPAHPKATDAYRQEYWQGRAEDQAWIVGRGARVHTPAGTFTHVVRSFEWSRLEPRVVSVKFYAPGIGIVAEHDVSGGNERFDLVSVTH